MPKPLCSSLHEILEGPLACLSSAEMNKPDYDFYTATTFSFSYELSNNINGGTFSAEIGVGTG